MTTRRREACQNAIAWSVLVSELIDGHCTALELTEATGMRHETVLGYIRALRRRQAIYVAAWVEDSYGRRTTASYALGRKPDAARIPVPAADIKRAYRARKAANAVGDVWKLAA